MLIRSRTTLKYCEHSQCEQYIEPGHIASTLSVSSVSPPKVMYSIFHHIYVNDSIISVEKLRMK